MAAVLQQVRHREAGLHGNIKNDTYRASLPAIRLNASLELHTGCVNHVSFNESGRILSSVDAWTTCYMKRACRGGHVLLLLCRDQTAERLGRHAAGHLGREHT